MKKNEFIIFLRFCLLLVGPEPECEDIMEQFHGYDKVYDEAPAEWLCSADTVGCVDDWYNVIFDHQEYCEDEYVDPCLEAMHRFYGGSKCMKGFKKKTRNKKNSREDLVLYNNSSNPRDTQRQLSNILAVLKLTSYAFFFVFVLFKLFLNCFR